MIKGGIILRLIDVVLILLFGFISISEISRQSKIALPKGENIPLSNPDTEAILIIGITQNGDYLVENEGESITGMLQLKNYILFKQQEFVEKNAKIRIRIRSNFNAPVKYAIILANLCDDLNIPKSIDVEHKGT
ncbi:hypothetical protein JXJ21_18270 [candidate division KSB1 bacterium]|nr:hypothetical protein [candidate division KSB1 bacterium]